jgi:hypothetical protein
MPRGSKLPTRTYIEAHTSARLKCTELIRLMGSTRAEDLGKAKKLAFLLATDLQDMESLAETRPTPIRTHPDIGMARMPHHANIVPFITAKEIEDALGRGSQC